MLLRRTTVRPKQTRADLRRWESSPVEALGIAVVVALATVVCAGCTQPNRAGSEGAVDAAGESGAVATTAPLAVPVRPAATPLSIPPTPTAVPVTTRTMLFSGDVLSHTPVMAQARRYGEQSELDYDYRPMFAEVAPRIGRADLAICVLETPVSADNVGLTGYPTFEAPRELPDALVNAGYDGCSTASNHSFDRGADGVAVTLQEMDRVGLGHAGMARSADEAGEPQLYSLGGVTVAHLSYTYSLNGFVLPDDQPWLVDLNDVEAIVTEAARARVAGADIVVLSIQWGNEYQRAPSAEQLLLADALTASGVIDVIIGNHVHVVQPVSVVNGVPVVYGLGNSLSNQSDNCCRTGTQDGVMVEVTVQGNDALGFKVAGLAFAPTWVDRSDYTIVDLLAALDDSSLDPTVRAVYQASFDRTVEAIHSLDHEIPLAD